MGLSLIVPAIIGIAGNFALSLLTPTTKTEVEGNSIDDRTPPTAEYGYGLDYFYGYVKKESCSLIWARPLREEVVETTTRQGGKGMGGGTSTTTKNYNYYMTCAYAIGREITGIERVWLNDELMYESDQSWDKTVTFANHTEFKLGTSNQNPSSIISGYEGSVNALRGISYIIFDDYPIAEFNGSSFPNLSVEVKGMCITDGEVKISDLIKDVCLKAGLSESEVNVDEIDDLQIKGYKFSSGKTYRSVIEDLQRIWGIVVQERDGIIYFKKKSGSIVTRIGEKHLGSEQNNTSSHYEQKKLAPTELPSSISLNFINGVDYESSVTTSRDPSAVHDNVLDLSTSAIYWDSNMYTRAYQLLIEVLAEDLEIKKINLLPAWAKIYPGDIISFIKDTDRNYAKTFQVSKRTRGDNNLIELELISSRGYISSETRKVTYSLTYREKSPGQVEGVYYHITATSYNKYTNFADDNDVYAYYTSNYNTNNSTNGFTPKLGKITPDTTFVGSLPNQVGGNFFYGQTISIKANGVTQSIQPHSNNLNTNNFNSGNNTLISFNLSSITRSDGTTVNEDRLQSTTSTPTTISGTITNLKSPVSITYPEIIDGEYNSIQYLIITDGDGNQTVIDIGVGLIDINIKIIGETTLGVYADQEDYEGGILAETLGYDLFNPDFDATVVNPPTDPIPLEGGEDLDTDRDPPTPPKNYGTAEAIGFEIPVIKDEDDFTFYTAIKPLEDWSNGAIYASSDNGSSYQLLSSVIADSLTGMVATAIGDHNTALIDNSTTITVVMDDNNQLFNSVTESEFYQAKSLLWLSGEIIAYKDVTLLDNDPLTYSISHLIRGCYGTEYYTDKHQNNERLIILSDYLVQYVGSQSDVNKTIRLKAVGTNQIEPNVTTYNTLTTTGLNVKPLPPYPVLISKSGNDFNINWYRRTRRDGGLKDYQDIGYATNELRQYKLEVLDGINVVRIETIIDTESFVYTSAMQNTDFGSNQSSISIRINQLTSYPVSVNNARIING